MRVRCADLVVTGPGCADQRHRAVQRHGLARIGAGPRSIAAHCLAARLQTRITGQGAPHRHQQKAQDQHAGQHHAAEQVPHRRPALHANHQLACAQHPHHCHRHGADSAHPARSARRKPQPLVDQLLSDRPGKPAQGLPGHGGIFGTAQRLQRRFQCRRHRNARLPSHPSPCLCILIAVQVNRVSHQQLGEQQIGNAIGATAQVGEFAGINGIDRTCAATTQCPPQPRRGGPAQRDQRDEKRQEVDPAPLQRLRYAAIGRVGKPGGDRCGKRPADDRARESPDRRRRWLAAQRT